MGAMGRDLVPPCRPARERGLGIVVGKTECSLNIHPKGPSNHASKNESIKKTKVDPPTLIWKGI